MRYWLGWPRIHLAMEQIASATVIDVRPMEWGGWGYRGSLKLFDKAALIYRAGPGLRVDLHSGKTFVVTLDDPEPAAAVLNTEIARLPQPATSS